MLSAESKAHYYATLYGRILCNTRNDNGRYEAVARNILKGFYFFWCVRPSALVYTVHKLKYRVRGLT